MENSKDIDARKILDDFEKYRIEKEKKFNESKIDDLTGLELKDLIESIAKREAAQVRKDYREQLKKILICRFYK